MDLWTCQLCKILRGHGCCFAMRLSCSRWCSRKFGLYSSCFSSNRLTWNRFVVATAMGRISYALSLASCLSSALAGRVPRQVTSTQYTNSSVTTKTPTDPSASGEFCCQVYAPAAALNWWYTDSTIQAVQQTVVTQYMKYNNTVIPTATVTITNSSAADVIGTYNPGGGPRITIPGIPSALNAPPALGQKYDQTIVLTGTQEDLGYTTM